MLTNTWMLVSVLIAKTKSVCKVKDEICCLKTAF